MLNILTGLYKRANESRLLETDAGKALFRTAYFFYKRHFEDFYVNLLRRHPNLLRNGHIIDVGANIGYTTILFARYASPGYKVFAIEPHPSNFQKLQENIARYKLQDRVVLIQAAVGEEDGEITLWQNEASHADHRILTTALQSSLSDKPYEALKVPMTTLDSLSNSYGLKGSVKFVKIDVQGYELSVLGGMRNLLDDNPELKACLEYDPAMMKEMGFEAAEIFDFFAGYTKYLIVSKGIERFEDKGKLNQLGKGYSDILFSKLPI